MDNLEGTLFFIFGAMFGSFANVVIYRLPNDESVVTPRSRCPGCKKAIAWYDNIPIAAWLLLRGKCRHCKNPISWRYPLVEFLMGATFCALYFHVGVSWLLLEYCIFAFGLITASFIDFDHYILPDEFTIGGTVIGLVGAFLNPEREFLQSVYGVLAGGGFLWLISWLYLVIRKQEGMGGGDVKLLAWIGAILGWKAIPFVILFSSVVGTFVGVFQMIRTKGGLQTAIPFGPYLALAALVYIFSGSSLAESYIQFFIPSLGVPTMIESGP